MFVLAASNNPLHRRLVRSQFRDYALRNAVLLALAAHPDPVDLNKYLSGLKASDFDVLRPRFTRWNNCPRVRIRPPSSPC